MIKFRLIIFLLLIVTNITQAQNNTKINQSGKTIKTRINTPEGFYRITHPNNSFENYLQNLALKPHGSKVYFYNGIIKPNHWVYQAVVDIEIGNRNLQQCADAIMRLRAEYLYSQKKYDQIKFNFTNGFCCEYLKWMQGHRIIVERDNVCWKKKATIANTYPSFRKYMNIVFAYAGTLSLEKELKPVNIKDLKTGDVFIQGGSPGHAVLVVDVAKNSKNQKIFLLAQSYMPAQDIHILKNLKNKELSPWFSANHIEKLVTPEWTFNKTDLRRF